MPLGVPGALGVIGALAPGGSDSDAELDMLGDGVGVGVGVAVGVSEGDDVAVPVGVTEVVIGADAREVCDNDPVDACEAPLERLAETVLDAEGVGELVGVP